MRYGNEPLPKPLALAHELLALRHAELVLLVNDHQARGSPGANPASISACVPMVSVGAAGAGHRLRLPDFWTLDSATLDLTRLPAARLQFHGDAQRLQPAGEVPEVLFRQNFGRRHERDVVAAFQRHQRAARRHDRLAGADVALQQPPHRVRAGQVLAQLAQDFGLRLGQLEAEPGEKGLDEMIVAAARQRPGLGLEVPPAKLYLPLQLDELVQRQPPPRQLGVRERLPGNAACESPGRAVGRLGGASCSRMQPPAKARGSALRIARASAR